EAEAGDPFGAVGSMAPGAAPAAPMAKKAARSRAEARAQSTPVQTRTVEVGDLFQYQIKNPVTVKRNQSALVPILQGPFEGKRVAVYNREIRDKNPMSAVLFKNTTGMTLEGGPVTVLEDDNYVGEAMLDTMKPAEERLVPYSVELGCQVVIDHRSEVQNVRFARIVDGWLYLTRYRIERTIYLVESKIDRKLDLFLEHRFNKGWDLIDTEKPVETTDNFHRFRMDVAPRRPLKFVVSERHDDQESHSLESVDKDTIHAWLESRYIDKATLQVLEQLHKETERVHALEEKIERLESQEAKIFEDQERLRKNLGALKTGPDERSLRERYVASLGKDEDRLKDLRDQIDKAKDEKEAAEKQLRERLSHLRFETSVS
ncbi:MAG TPA: hypothetical protein VFF73_13255, partial [Planctomycetota bacterium]|nr:hypothetical protein [Planctomycetota bacterium]